MHDNHDIASTTTIDHDIPEEGPAMHDNHCIDEETTDSKEQTMHDTANVEASPTDRGGALPYELRVGVPGLDGYSLSFRLEEGYAADGGPEGLFVHTSFLNHELGVAWDVTGRLGGCGFPYEGGADFDEFARVCSRRFVEDPEIAGGFAGYVATALRLAEECGPGLAEAIEAWALDGSPLDPPCQAADEDE